MRTPSAQAHSKQHLTRADRDRRLRLVLRARPLNNPRDDLHVIIDEIGKGQHVGRSIGKSRVPQKLSHGTVVTGHIEPSRLAALHVFSKKVKALGHGRTLTASGNRQDLLSAGCVIVDAESRRLEARAWLDAHATAEIIELEHAEIAVDEQQRAFRRDMSFISDTECDMAVGPKSRLPCSRWNYVS